MASFSASSSSFSPGSVPSGSTQSPEYPHAQQVPGKNQIPPDQKAAYDHYKHIFPQIMPVRAEAVFEAAQSLTHLHILNTKLKEDIEKAKADAAKPKPEAISLQLLKLTPAALQASAIAIPFFGTIIIESIKLAGMFLIAGAALGAAHELSDGSVRVMKTITKEAGVALKVIAFLGAGAAILKGGHTVITEGPKTVTSVVDKIRARLFPKSQEHERPRGQFMIPQFLKRQPNARVLQEIDNSSQE